MALRIALLTSLLVLLLLVSTASTGAQEPSPLAMIISGGDLPHSVRLAHADQDAFARRFNLPPLLDEEPEVAGDSYRVVSSYWDEAVRNHREDRAAVSPIATYYQSNGYVRARQADKDVWLVLDLKQRAILDRYIKLTRAGLLSERPGLAQVLAVAYRSEDIGVQMAGEILTPEERRAFFLAFANRAGPSFAEPANPPLGARGVWVVFTLNEGRSLQLFYERQANLLVDSFGAEVYLALPPLQQAIDGISPPSSAPPAIEQGTGNGSPIWWLIMPGAGLACIAAAVWLRRSAPALPSE